MSIYTLIKLKNLTPVHMGNGKENYDFSASHLQSDTLSAALAATRAQSGKRDNLSDFLDSFTISSAFPYIGNRYFMPKPLGKIEVRVNDADEYSIKKSLKKIEFIKFPLWKDLIQGKTLQINRYQLRGNYLIEAKDENSFLPPYKSQVNQRVSVPRDEKRDTEPFFFEWTYFNQNAGLFCIVCSPEEMKNEIISLFEEMGENGIGTDKNIGGGKFEIETNNWDFPTINNPNASMLLSLYIPTSDEIGNLNLESSKYELILRGGYMAGSEDTKFRHLRKKSIYMFNYGSVFHTTQSFAGKIIDLKPNWNDKNLHPVYRSGKPFIIPIKHNDYESHQD